VKAIISILGIVVLFGCGTSSTVRTPQPRNQIAPESGNLPPKADSTLRDGGAGSEGRLLTAYFDYDESGLRADAKSALRQNADVLCTRTNARVELQGNCDERGTDEYNMALGKRRAEAARRYLADLGVADSRMTTVSFGEENPAVQGGSEAAWAKNRRVDFVLR